MAPGEAQELLVEQYLRLHRHCIEIFRPETDVRTRLGLPTACRCADILALHSPQPAVSEITIAESKGTDVDRALTQLGNASAGAFESFPGLRTVHLLVWVARTIPTAAGTSPGPGFTITGGAGVPRLQDARTSTIVPARAVIDLGHPWNRWSPQVQQLDIELLVG